MTQIDPPVASEPNRRAGFRFAVMMTVSGVIGLLIWMALDWAYVRVPGWHTDNLEKVYTAGFFLFPLIVGFYVRPQARMLARSVMAVVFAVVTCIFTVVLIAFIGMQFHFAIGGQS